MDKQITLNINILINGLNLPAVPYKPKEYVNATKYNTDGILVFNMLYRLFSLSDFGEIYIYTYS
jgi:hypothetical protein